MVKVKFSGLNVSNTYQLRREGKKTLVWAHKTYKGPVDTDKDYSDVHDVTQAEADKMGVQITNGNLTVMTEKKKKGGK